ncbi:TetR/AcrR family transcriptional regulator [Microbacterium sp. X-17]|uniref:TetR/AcrR family transcriptional regulator n=1 Tax=Microbacterium sp. X-17 TaxID=3144404 RepID=UPI0031F4BD28
MSNLGSKRGPYARSLKRREDIASAVLELIDEVGHEGVTTTLVADRSGISEATVLYHFPSKDHMLVAALQRADELTAAESGVTDLFSSDFEPDPHGLDLFADTLSATSGVDTSARARLLYMLRGQAATPGSPAATYFEERDARSIGIFAKLIQARQSAGLAHPAVNARDAATQFIAMWNGLGAMAFLHDDVEVNRLLLQALRLLLGEQVMAARMRLDDLQP